MYSDGSDTYLALVDDFASTADNATIAAADSVVTNLVRFVGMTDPTTLAGSNFTLVA